MKLHTWNGRGCDGEEERIEGGGSDGHGME